MSLAERALDSDPAVLDDTVLRDIRARLGAAGLADCAAFVLVELCDRGLQATVVDAGTGSRVAERGDDALSPRMLDRAVADHLVRTGRVERPESDEWVDELLHLVTGLRTTLATADGAFAMGTAHVGLVRVSRRDLVVALHPHLMVAAALWRSAAADFEPPVGAVVFLPDHRRWPGLFESLAQNASIPAVAVEDEVVPQGRGRARHGAPAATSQPVVAVPGQSEQVSPVTTASAELPSVGPDAAFEPPVQFESPVPLEPTPVFASMSRPVEPMPVPVAVPVPTPVAVPAPVVPPDAPAAFVPQPVVPGSSAPPSPPAGPHLPPPFAPPPRRVRDIAAPIVPGDPWNPPMPAPGGHDAFFGPGGEREPISVHDHRDVRDPGGPRHYSPPTMVTDTASPEARRVHNRRLLIGAGAVASSAALGIIVLTLPWIDQGPPTIGGQINAAQTAQPPVGAVSTPSPTQPSRPPLDLGAARSPATQYTTPPPVVTPPTAQAAPRRSNPAPRARPRPRSIPNPIPGLPPILLP
ncbi:hypothetical protein [Williamsia phyllosphaerae]|uniref:Agglutinin receptor n=1 Tax=Williamsia phyllosphaerae TaxID=885042 RepID=A0ABQ1UAT5_9NOCA|nr:hypothetical protein [Williamsia phyllosphaerae]GGF12941.1 hypothetical protein GCM10007298_06070 [Williamsia phyllosphaerae]